MAGLATIAGSHALALQAHTLLIMILHDSDPHEQLTFIEIQITVYFYHGCWRDKAGKAED
jgi:hypothetical protein